MTKRQAQSHGREPVVHQFDAEDCSHVIDHIHEFLDSEMTPADQEQMRAHMAHCAPCLAELSVEELVKEMVRRSCHELAPTPLRERIAAQMAAWQPSVDAQES